MGKPLKRTAETISKVLESYSRLKSGNAVAKELKISPPTVYKVLKDHNIEVQSREVLYADRRKFKGEEEKAVIAEYLSGTSLEELKQKFNCGDYSIRETIRRNNLPLRSKGGQKVSLDKSEEESVVKEYIETDASQQYLAVKFGCSQALISRTLRKYDVDTTYGKGPRAGSWKGGVSIDYYGYVQEWVSDSSPYACMRNKSSYVRQHRLRMAEKIGRPLFAHETVHHIDGNKQNNSIENLQLRTGKHGSGVKCICLDCGSSNIEYSELD